MHRQKAINVMDAPKRNHVIFYDTCVPPFRSGDDYHVRVGQYLYESDRAARIDSTDYLPRNQRQHFTVIGPRFRLMPDDIHSVSPPANGEGPFAARLPQIVLRRRTLPWERRTSDTDEDTPWMALLLFEESEIESGHVVLHSPPSMTVQQAVGSSNSTLKRANLSGVGTQGAQPCLAVDISAGLLPLIMPKADEVQLLAHVRQVNTRDKELLGMDKDGWFAVVVGNRLPTPDRAHVACLVSLEGHAGHLPTEMDVEAAMRTEPFENVTATPTNASTVFTRFVVLAQWQFHCWGERDFEGTARRLHRLGGVGMLGVNQEMATGGRTSSRYQVALDSGHVPLQHQTRNGEQTIAWYRGPMTPVGVTPDRSVGPFHSADQARRIDPETGLENLGYAAAFEIGRLLALSDKQFAVALMQWRRIAHQQRDRGFILPRLELDAFAVENLIDLKELLAKMEIVVLRELLENIMGIDDFEQFINEFLPVIDPTGLHTLGQPLPGLALDAGSVNAMLFGLTSETESVLPGVGEVGTEFDRGTVELGFEHDFNTLVDDVELLNTQTLYLQQQRERILKDVADSMPGGAG